MRILAMSGKQLERLRHRLWLVIVVRHAAAAVLIARVIP
jgi:hypothetical protein